MKLTKRNTYPAYTTDDYPDVVLEDRDGQALFRTHDFDKAEHGNRVKKWRKDDINFGNAPLRGLLPLRYLYYRANEAKIPATLRMGIEK